jgi:pyridoxamine 5'-phosphate oxidase
MLPQELLPEELPSDPLPVFARWFEESRERRLQPNPDAMVLATVGVDGQPSARVVLCKQILLQLGCLVFFTNYQSRKGRELHEHPCAAVVFHWDVMHRQVRIEGRITRSPDSESDAYFATRALDSQIGAWASEQSSPLASRDALAQRVRDAQTRFGIGTPAARVSRPPHWGGFRLWIETIELWMEGSNRVHDRAVWRRTLARANDGYVGSDWSATRLYP